MLFCLFPSCPRADAGFIGGATVRCPVPHHQLHFAICLSSRSTACSPPFVHVCICTRLAPRWRRLPSSAAARRRRHSFSLTVTGHCPNSWFRLVGKIHSLPTRSVAGPRARTTPRCRPPGSRTLAAVLRDRAPPRQASGLAHLAAGPRGSHPLGPCSAPTSGLRPVIFHGPSHSK